MKEAYERLLRSFASLSPTLQRACGLSLAVLVAMLLTIALSPSNQQANFERIAEEPRQQDELASARRDYEKTLTTARNYACDEGWPDFYNTATSIGDVAARLAEEEQHPNAISKYSEATGILESIVQLGKLRAKKQAFERYRDELGIERIRTYASELWRAIESEIASAVDPKDKAQVYSDCLDRLRNSSARIDLAEAKGSIEQNKIADGLKTLAGRVNNEAQAETQDVVQRLADRGSEAWSQAAIDTAYDEASDSIDAWTLLGETFASAFDTDRSKSCFDKALQLSSAATSGANVVEQNCELALAMNRTNDNRWKTALKNAADICDGMSDRDKHDYALARISGTALICGDEELFGVIIEDGLPRAPNPGEYDRDRYRQRSFNIKQMALGIAGRTDAMFALRPSEKRLAEKFVRAGYEANQICFGATGAANKHNEANYVRTWLAILPSYARRRLQTESWLRTTRVQLAKADATLAHFERASIAAFNLRRDERGLVFSTLSSRLAAQGDYTKAKKALDLAIENYAVGLPRMRSMAATVRIGPGVRDPFVWRRLTGEKVASDDRIAIMAGLATRNGASGALLTNHKDVPATVDLDGSSLKTPNEWLKHALADLHKLPPSMATAQVAIAIAELSSDPLTSSDAYDLSWEGILSRFKLVGDAIDKVTVTPKENEITTPVHQLINMMLQLADAQTKSGDLAASRDTLFNALRAIEGVPLNWQRGATTRQDILAAIAVRARGVGADELYESCKNLALKNRDYEYLFDARVNLADGNLRAISITPDTPRKRDFFQYRKKLLARFLAELAAEAAKQANMSLYRKCATQVQQINGKGGHTYELLAIADVYAKDPGLGQKRFGTYRSHQSQMIRANVIDLIADENFDKADALTRKDMSHPQPWAIAQQAVARSFTKRFPSEDKIAEYLQQFEKDLVLRAAAMTGFAEAKLP